MPPGASARSRLHAQEVQQPDTDPPCSSGRREAAAKSAFGRRISISSREITQDHPAPMFPRSGTRSVPCRRKTRWRGGRGLALVSSRVPRVTIRAASPRIPGGFGGLRARRNLPTADRPRAEVATREVVLWRDRDRHTRRHADQFTPVNPIKMPCWSAAITALTARMSTRAAPHYLMRLSPARLPVPVPAQASASRRALPSIITR